MSTEQSPADRYLELCMRRVELWEQATTARQEHEQSEAFTRAFAELHEVLSHGGTLPQAWAGATRPDGISPVQQLLGAHSVRFSKPEGDNEL